MKQHIEAVNNVDDEGRPAGGYVEGVGLRIDWQDGPLRLGDDDQYAGVSGVCRCGRKASWTYDPATMAPSPVKEPEDYCALHGPNSPDRPEPNGAFVETVIAAAVQRIEHYQGSQFRCRENAIAITKLEEALLWLGSRTARRESEGVEGTHGLDASALRGASG